MKNYKRIIDGMPGESMIKPSCIRAHTRTTLVGAIFFIGLHLNPRRLLAFEQTASLACGSVAIQSPSGKDLNEPLKICWPPYVDKNGAVERVVGYIFYYGPASCGEIDPAPPSCQVHSPQADKAYPYHMYIPPHEPIAESKAKTGSVVDSAEYKANLDKNLVTPVRGVFTKDQVIYSRYTVLYIPKLSASETTGSSKESPYVLETAFSNESCTPTTPQKISGKASGKSVILRWEPSKDPIGVWRYEIYRNDRGNKPIGTAETNEYEDKTASPDKQYQYRIRALDHQMFELNGKPIYAPNASPLSDPWPSRRVQPERMPQPPSLPNGAGLALPSRGV